MNIPLAAPVALALGALAHAVLYKFARAYRQWAEVMAYRVQMRYPDRHGKRLSLDDAAYRLTGARYDLGLTLSEARVMIETAPVDRTKQVLTDGRPVPADYSHTQDRGDGQQKGYIVLSAEERAKGFVRPVRQDYVHKKCGVRTVMALSIAETYARDPKFYNGTFCAGCKAHFPLDQFVGDGTDEMVGS